MTSAAQVTWQNIICEPPEASHPVEGCSQNQNGTRHEGILVIVQKRLKVWNNVTQFKDVATNSHLSPKEYRVAPSHLTKILLPLTQRERKTMAFGGVASWRVARRSSGLGARWMSTWWRSVEPASKDPILGVTEAFLADLSPSKVNVGVVSSFFTFK